MTSMIMMTRFPRQVHTQGLVMTLRGLWKYAQIRTLMDEGTIAGYLAITEQRKVKPKIENLSRRMKSHARHGRRQLAEVTVYCRIL